jgi:sodium-dependent phosphate cotransporter
MKLSHRVESVVRVLALLALLYLFFLSISLLGASFKAQGKSFAEGLLSATSSPFVGLFIGILATSVLQSSSTVTSMTVGLVAGGALDVAHAIPIIMGSNIGTSVTNTLVSLGHLRRSDEFRRAFAAATVHDFFNLCAVVVLFPLQLLTNFLGVASETLTTAFAEVGGLKFLNPLKTVLQPVVGAIADLTSHSGPIMLAVAVVLLFFSLRYIVANLKALVIGKVAGFFESTLFRTAGRAMVLGLLLTVMVQSSSITTSLAVPLAGAGILTLRQIFPYTLGANIGTTITAILASLVTGEEAAVTVAFAHLLFNLVGIVLIWPIRSLPLFLAEALAVQASRSRLVPLVYTGVVFFLVPIVFIYLGR